MGSIDVYLPSRNLKGGWFTQTESSKMNEQTNLAQAQAAAENPYANRVSGLGIASAAKQIEYFTNAQVGTPADTEEIGVFRIQKAEDGFIVRCSANAYSKPKSFVASDINEVFEKAKAFLVSEALAK